jgi:aspartate kinase
LASESAKPQAGEVGCEIYTDVDGVYTTDPRVVPEAHKMDFISYDEMLELASVGAGVMHSRSIEFAKKFDVPLQVRSSFTDTEGTWIVPEADWMREVAVCGCAIVKDEARINLADVPDEPGISHRVFSAIAEQNIVVDMIVQNVGSAGKANIGFTVLKNELPATLAVLGPLAASLGAKVEHEEEVSKVSIVGTGMRTHTGVAERLFAALTAAGVNMKMITTGDIKISVLVDKADGTKALRAMHQAFQLEKAPLALREAASSGQERFQRREPAIVDDTRDLASITHRLSSMEDIVVSDILLDIGQGRVTVTNLPDRPGHCSRIFQAVAGAGVVVDMIVQNVAGPGRAELSFSVPLKDLELTLEQTRKIAAAIDPAIRVAGDPNIARLFVLGVGMRTHTGVARRMFGALAQRGINISMINTSEVCVNVVVDRPHGEEALAALKEAFHIA